MSGKKPAVEEPSKVRLPDVKIPPILPDSALKFAWSLTLSFSGYDDAKMEAQYVRDAIKGIKNRVTKRVDESDEKEKVEAIKDLTYFETIEVSIRSCVRNLLIITRGRNKNFEETDVLLKSQIESIASISKLSANLQSGIGRVASMTFGGATAGAIIASFWPGLPDWVLPLSVAAIGALAYGVHEALFVPWSKNKVEKELINTEARRGMYFQQYVQRCSTTLNSLLDDALRIYSEVYDSPYHEEKFNDPEERRKVVTDTLSGIENVSPFVCKHLTKHFLEGKITRDLWAICESGREPKYCEHWKDGASP